MSKPTSSVDLDTAYALLEPRALKAVGEGEGRISIQALAEDERRESHTSLNHNHFRAIAKRLISNHPALAGLIETRKPPQTDKFAIVQAVKRVEAQGFRCVSMTFSDGNRKVTASISAIRKLADALKKAS